MTRFAMCKCGSISTYTPQSYLYRLNATEHGSMPTHAAQSYLIQPNSTVHSSMPTHAAQSYLIRPNATVHGSMPTHAAQSYLIRPQCHRTRFQAFSSAQCGSFTVKTVRSLLLSAVIVPPCAVTISLAMARPSPAPPLSVERAESSL